MKRQSKFCKALEKQEKNLIFLELRLLKQQFPFLGKILNLYLSHIFTNLRI